MCIRGRITTVVLCNFLLPIIAVSFCIANTLPWLDVLQRRCREYLCRSQVHLKVRVWTLEKRRALRIPGCIAIFIGTQRRSHLNLYICISSLIRIERLRPRAPHSDVDGRCRPAKKIFTRAECDLSPSDPPPVHLYVNFIIAGELTLDTFLNEGVWVSHVCAENHLAPSVDRGSREAHKKSA